MGQALTHKRPKNTRWIARCERAREKEIDPVKKRFWDGIIDCLKRGARLDSFQRALLEKNLNDGGGTK